MNNPRQDPWMSMLIPPERFQPLEVQLSDLSVRRAIWTGAKWWSDNREVAPRAWRPLDHQPARITA